VNPVLRFSLSASGRFWPTELADYSVCTTWGMKREHFYLLNVFRKKLPYPDLKRAVIEQKQLFNPSTILIEGKASGTQLIQDLIEGGLSMVTRFKPDGDKIMRLHAQTATIENGFVHLPNEAHLLADYLHELTVFPNGRYDDQVDSTAQALAWTKLRPAGWGMLEFYRLEHERAQGRLPPATIRLKPPPGISHVVTISGQQVAVTNGFVDVLDGEHLPLLGAGFTIWQAA
jgi:predicted phage terminase large subunit-like protein